MVLLVLYSWLCCAGLPDAMPDALPDVADVQGQIVKPTPTPAPPKPVLAQPVVSIVMVTSAGCQPCQTMKPVLAKLTGQAAVSIVDYDDSKQAALIAAHQVRMVPFLIARRNGRDVETTVGAMTEQELRAWITRVKAGSPAPDGSRFHPVNQKPAAKGDEAASPGGCTNCRTGRFFGRR